MKKNQAVRGGSGSSKGLISPDMKGVQAPVSWVLVVYESRLTNMSGVVKPLNMMVHKINGATVDRCVVSSSCNSCCTPIL